MKGGTPGFVGARLIEARRASSMTAVALAKAIGVTPGSISNYESDRQTPSPEVMDLLVGHLKIPRARFMRPVGPADDAPEFWRSKSTATKTARDRALVRLEWLRETFCYLLNYYDFPAVNLPTLDVPADFKRIDRPFLENAALKVREHWGIGGGPMPDLLLEMENNGIVVSRIYTDAETLDAFSQWSNTLDRPFVVLGRDKSSAVRQRFDAAHELFHLLAHRHIDKKRIETPQDFKLLEDQAHHFACALLLPEKGFVDELWGCTLDAFLALKERWRVSIAAMIMRCKALNLISDSEVQRLYINKTRRGWRQVEPLDNKLDKERPRLLRRSMEGLLSERVQSVSQILSSLALPPTDIEEICDLDEGRLGGAVPEEKAAPTLKRSAHSVAEAGTNIVQFGLKRKPT